MSILFLLSQGFWLWMLIDCMQNDPQKNTWIYVLIFANVPGAIAYFVVRKLPYLSIPSPSFFKRWTKKDALWSAQAAAHNIGHAHQYIKLGNIWLEIDRLDEAQSAYKKALEKEPNNIYALWGTATIALRQHNYQAAQTDLQTIYQLEPDFKFGEASLVYGQTLYALKEWDLAKRHIEQDIKQWSHLDSYIMLATIERDNGNIEMAIYHLETMLFKVKGTPAFHHRKNSHFIRKAEKMLRTLKR
jgi:tetratricopeptide (TPR) repeat protein